MTPKNVALTYNRSVHGRCSDVTQSLITTKKVLQVSLYFNYFLSEKTCNVPLPEFAFVWALAHNVSVKEICPFCGSNHVVSRNSSQKTGN